MSHYLTHSGGGRLDILSEKGGKKDNSGFRKHLVVLQERTRSLEQLMKYEFHDTR